MAAYPGYGDDVQPLCSGKNKPGVAFQAKKKKTPGPGVNGQERFYLRPICNRGNFCHFSPVLCDNFVDNKGPAMVNPAYFRGFIGLI